MINERVFRVDFYHALTTLNEVNVDPIFKVPWSPDIGSLFPLTSEARGDS
ncbi:BnaA02g18560D [Brassica napus]|uniref:(rape) hypothetical protein n=1 Tax=Brassica napus TaxID=3708 RepID=A0A078HNG6_BRANA|nr:unnamed protein product [Brassica napus]CDY38363.1 BnaA02g18560D [Brassica napus]